MSKFKNWLVSAFVALAVAGCGGGGGDAGESVFGDGDTPGTTATAAAIELIADADEIATGSSTEVAVTAIVKKAGNVVLPDAPVAFESSSGSLTVVSSTTDDSGVVTAILRVGTTVQEKTNRNITITATSGSVTQSLEVAATGSALLYSGPTSLSTGGGAVSMTIVARDSRGQAIVGAPITVSNSQIGNAFASTTVSTNGTGTATFTYTPTSSGTDVLTFTGLGATPVSTTLNVSGEDFVFLSPSANATVNVGASQTMRVRYRVDGIPQVGLNVQFSATAGTLSSSTVVTDGSGEAQVQITSSYAGQVTVQAAISGVTTITLPIEVVATTPSSVNLQATPTSLAPNAVGSTTQQSTLLARVIDASGNPVKGTTVNFSLITNPSSGGNLSNPSAVTDSNGYATVKYISGSTSTANGEIQVRATVQGTSITDDEYLTVNQSALFIVLGTGNVIGNLDTETYRKNWTVYVTDADGVAVPNVTLTLRVLPMVYRKGRMFWNEDSNLWSINDTPYAGAQSTTTDLALGAWLECSSEDADNDGVLDPGEEGNGSGSLEPGNVISLESSTVTTDDKGRATVALLYAESYHPWVKVKLRATATVSGTESVRDATFVVPANSDDLNQQDTSPAGAISPFGYKASCATTD